MRVGAGASAGLLWRCHLPDDGRDRTPLAGKRGLQASGPPGVLYDPEIPDDEGEPAEAFIPLAALVVLPRSERVVMLDGVPAAQVAVLVNA